MGSNIVPLLTILSLSLQCANALSPAAIASGVPNSKSVQAASLDNGGLVTEGVATLDGMALNAIPEGRSAEAVMASSISKTAWIATADSFQPGYDPSNVLDGDLTTFWHTPFGPDGDPLPHYLQIDMRQTYLINSIAYIPRQDTQSNGNVGEHTITLSNDGVTFTSPVAEGTYADTNLTKTTIFKASYARYVRFTAFTEAGARGPWSSCASFNIFQTTDPGEGPNVGVWSPTIDFPLVPVSMALEHDTGNVLVWSSYAASTFGGSNGGNTLTASYDPATGIVSQRNISNTDHDMFCEGLSMDSHGRFVATGGNNAPKTSIYSPRYDAWTAGTEMNIARGYQSQATTSEGYQFTIGGSWSGDATVAKDGEIYNPFDNTWTLLPGCPVAPMLTNDLQGTYRADNHGMLFGWKNGYVFQAGPSYHMNWYGTDGQGSNAPAGTRGDDTDAMAGNAVMYDAAAGKILVVGGATSYQGVNATANAHILTLNGPNDIVDVENINPMWFQRIFANAVVLPSGHVFITGGQIFGQPFSDDTAQLQAEIWDPVSTNFIKVAPHVIPRNYHSTAILMADGTVLNGGGGLCGACATNHYDAEIYSPSYLFNADGSRAVRPVILSAPAQAEIGGNLIVETDSTVTNWSFIRLGSTTHTVNTDQRRIPLYAIGIGNTYTMPLPTDPGIMIPGHYMLFALNEAGVPSVAKFIWVPVPQ